MKRRLIGAVLAAATVASCSTLAPTPGPSATASIASQPAPTQANPTRSPSPAPSPVAGGCAGTQVFVGGNADAGLGLASNPWADATPASSGIVAYFWHEPPALVIAHEGQVGSKVLWVVHATTAGELVIAATPAGKAGIPAIQIVAPAAVSPADNFPSSLDLPTPGCWQLELKVGAITGSMGIEVAAAP